MLVFLVLNSSGTVSSQTGSENRWTLYRNSHYSFLLRYPADQWSHYEPIDGNGVVLAPRDQSRFHLPPQIRVGGGVGQPSDADEFRNETLEEDFQAGLNSLNEYGHAKNVTVLSKTAAKVEGRSAIRQHDPLRRFSNSCGVVS